MTRIAWLLLALFAASPAAADRFPQPVRAGDLVGRSLIGPSEAQPPLGRVEGVDRAPQGGASLRIRTWSLLPWGGRSVDVPLDSVALLGELVGLVGLTPDQYAALPGAGPASPVDPNEQLHIGLARPFH